MNIVASVSLFACITSIFLGNFIICLNPRKLLNWLFFLYCMTIAHYSFMGFEMRSAETMEEALLWMNKNGIWPFSASLLLHFVLVFTKKTKLLSNKLTYLVLYLPALIFSTVLLLRDFPASNLQKLEMGGWAFRMNQGWPFYKAIVFWSAGLAIISVVFSFLYYRKAKVYIDRKRSKYVAIGVFVPVVLSIISDFEVPGLGLRIPNFSEMSFVFGSIFLAYGIWKYKLFSITPETVAENIIQTMADALFLVDLEGHIVRTNQAAQELLGYKEEELVNLSFDSIMGTSPRSGKPKGWQPLADGFVKNYETFFRAKDKWIPISLSASAIQDRDEVVYGIIYVARDLSERKRAEEAIERKMVELERLNRQLKLNQKEINQQAKELNEKNKSLKMLNATKDKFFSIIAHDLRNPFSSIIGFSDLLMLRYDDFKDSKRKTFIKLINDSTKIIYKLLENLLQWAKSQTGNISYKPLALDLKELVDSNLILVEAKAKEKENKIFIDFQQGIQVYVDRNMINTVIMNLLHNAMKFTDKGEINIKAISEGKFTKLQIKDTGVGMEQEKLDKLFDIGSATTTEGTRGEQGSGLGLVLCKDFIEKNGGAIAVESEPGKGTTFILSLPMIREDKDLM